MIDATPQRLYLMQQSTSTIPTPGGPMDFSAGCYLVRMTDGTNVLVDSGHPTGFVPASGGPPAPGRNVVKHLADLGLRPVDIDVLVCTHFDPDHAGYHDAFPNSELVVQREHYELARSSGHPRYAATRPHWDHPALQYRLVDGDTELLPGVTLVETGGHTPGHQSVLVRLPRTGPPVLLAIDAVAMGHLFTPDRRAWPMDDDEERLRASTCKLLDLVERE